MKDPKTPQNTRKKGHDEKREFWRQSSYHSLIKRIFPQKKNEENKNMNSHEKSDQLGNDGSEKLETNSSIISSSNINRQEKSQNSEGVPEDSFRNSLKNYDAFKFLIDKRNIIIRAIAVVFAILLIIYGVIFSLYSSSVQVSSNVIFGERAMFSAFLVLIGSLIIVTVFARKLMEGTFLKIIYNELETVEGKTKRNGDEMVTEEDEGNDKD